MIDTYLSDKIKVISFVSMILVVFIHGTTMMFNFGGQVAVKQDYLNVFMQSAVSDGIARIAVPSFFAISGFLFFQAKVFTAKVFLDKFYKRFQSLLIPYLSWSLLSLLFYWLLQQIPFSKPFFTTRIVQNFSFSQLINVILFDPLAYQLWFIKDLMALVLLTPIIYLIIKHTRWLLVLVSILLWFINFYFKLFQNLSFCFFIVGATLALCNINFKGFSKTTTVFLLITWLFACFIRTYLITFSIIPFNSIIANAIQFASIFTGMIAVWYGYDYFIGNKGISKWWLSICNYTFFIYAFHEPLLTILRKASFYFSDKSVVSLFALYWICPLITVVITIFIAKLVQKILPNVYRVVNGGR